MAVLAPFLVLCACVLGLHHVEATPDILDPLDSSFCHGDLQVIYPQLEVDKCLIVGKSLREKLTVDWGAPEIHFPGAQKGKKYVMVMADPDAPRRVKQTTGYWRHWLVVDIQGGALKDGRLVGRTLTDYHPPSPPSKTGFHRYQFMLFEQPPGAQVSLTEKENASRGKWDLSAFTKKFGLEAKVATLQFLTKNYKD
ncbi:phosphatidylethanolamine-binding protein 4 [Xyrichtys novacula]|uniref:Phosphatidylethanolamine-binding protein 4 n=1 Tax=Xyrichtys novacula TaxID=13765 RepID=A0AAV1G560_XYRNO|nr:phosphatidylethanolamine-binding protein 4 [Xyrichtys novacula]